MIRVVERVVVERYIYISYIIYLVERVVGVGKCRRNLALLRGLGVDSTRIRKPFNSVALRGSMN